MQANIDTAGYHVYYLPVPKLFPKGSVLYVYLPDTAKMAVNTRSIGLYNDYDWNEQSLLDVTRQMSLLVNVIVNGDSRTTTTVSSQTRIKNKLSHSYMTAGLRTISASFVCDERLYSKNVMVFITGKF